MDVMRELRLKDAVSGVGHANSKSIMKFSLPVACLKPARTMGNRYVGHPYFSLCFELQQI